MHLIGPGTPPEDQGILQEQGFYVADPNKLLENKFHIVYIDYGLIQVSFLQTFNLKKGRCCNIDQIELLRITILPISMFSFKVEVTIISSVSESTQQQ